MNIEIKVTGLDNLAESIALLASAIGAHAGAQLKGTITGRINEPKNPAGANIEKEDAPAPKEDKPKAPSKPKAEKPKPAPEPEPTPGPDADDEKTEESAEEPTQESDAGEYTIEDIRAVLSPLSRAGHATDVKALIQKHGKAENVANVDPSLYPALMKAAKALEAKVKKNLEAGE